jgi:hypothetical protein
MGCYPTESILIQTRHSRRLVSASRIRPKSTVIIAARSRKHFFQLAIEQLANRFGQFMLGFAKVKARQVTIGV